MKTADIQKYLNRAGATPPLAVDGILGPKTKAAISDIQRLAGLRANGVIDTRTLAAIKRASLAPSADGGAALVQGSALDAQPAALAPPWLVSARLELGEKEAPGSKSNERIIEYRSLGKTTGDTATEDGSRPWCADFVNAMLEEVGIRGSRSGLAQSFARSDHFVKIEGPALGSIVVFWRKSKASGLGHVMFYEHEEKTKVFGVGGNQGDAVSRAGFAKQSPSFGVLGYYWPKGFPLPEIGAIAASASGPTNVSMV